jgi:hypothetical protein
VVLLPSADDPATSFLARRENGFLYYSPSRNAALYITPKTAVSASSAKNIIVMDFHPPSLANILLENEWSMMRS